jgi:aquaporin Z
MTTDAPATASLSRRAFAEFLGTSWLVFGGCGSAVLAATAPSVGIGWLGVSLAFGLTVLTMAYVVAPVSGCHLNPAVSVGLAASGRFAARDVPVYTGAQVLGSIAGTALLYLIAQGKAGFVLGTGWPANGFGEHSPGGYSLTAALSAEVVLTFFFVLVVVGVTSRTSLAGFAPIAIGLALTLVHLIGMEQPGR